MPLSITYARRAAGVTLRWSGVDDVPCVVAVL